MSINQSGKFDDVEDSSYVSGTLSVTNVAVEAKVGASPIDGRQSVSILNTSNVVVYFGPLGVTTVSGEPLLKNQRIEIPLGPNVGLYVIAASAGPHTVIVQERG